jgi:predicted dehydrogenase
MTNAARKPRFGLIGTGVWPRLVQAPAARASQSVALTSVFNRNQAKADTFANLFGARGFADLDAFLDSVDIVGITVPPAAQPHFALRAAKACKPVVLEKPLALDPIEADDIATAFESRGLTALVFFTRMLIPEARAWIDAARAQGGWLAARVDSISGLLSDPASPFYDTTATWRGAAGAFWDTGPHAVATLVTILGQVVEVSGIRGRGDLKLLALGHADGAVSSISLAMDAPVGAPGETALFGAAGKSVLPPSADWFGDATRAYGIGLEILAGGPAGRDHPVLPDARLGATVTKIHAAAERSLATGRRISLG